MFASHRTCLAGLVAAAALLAQQQARVEPLRDSGTSVTGAFEGWFQNPDGSYSLLLGYMNRNVKEELDIPVGPENRIEPGGPDLGQPTHFMPRRGWGVFTITVPKDFGAKKLTWTLTSHGSTNVIPMSLNPLWELAPFQDATGNAPPYLGFSEKGPFAQGPRGPSTSLSASAGAPVELAVWTADDANSVPGAPRNPAPAVALTWTKFRGPGAVQFSKDKPSIETVKLSNPPERAVFQGKAITSATFSAPGEYILKVTANDWSGEGGRGFQCCWTNAQVKVSVKPAGGK